MLGCDNCDRWFHGSCMKIDTATGDALSNWVCPPCSKGAPIQAATAEKHTALLAGDKTVLLQESVNPLTQPPHLDISPHAPNPESLWPPFGLRSSKQAIEALGNVGESDNEECEFSLQHNVSSQPVSNSAASMPSQNISQICPFQPEASGASKSAPSVSQLIQSAVTISVPDASTLSSHSTLETSDLAQRSGMANNQVVISSLSTLSSSMTTNHPSSSAALCSTDVETKTLSPSIPSFNNSSPARSIAEVVGLENELSVAVANLDAFVLAAEDIHQLRPVSVTSPSVETEKAVVGIATSDIPQAAPN